jgi:hypothetical protein
VQGSGVARELRRRARLTWSRAELAQYDDFAAYSPQPGALAIDAFRAAFDAGVKHGGSRHESSCVRRARGQSVGMVRDG